jgi:tetratricopeptide (TPR) repeat protein
MVAVPEHGRLEEIPLPRLLLDLYRARFGGALTLSRDRVGKRFLFQEGVPVFAESNLASESLGVQLMDTGKITRADYSRVVTHIERAQCKEGTALLELGLLEPKELFVALKDQVRTRIVECFGWPHGEFYVDPTSESSPDAQPFRADLYGLLQEGIEAHWSSERILSDLGPRMERYARPAKRFEGVIGRLRVDGALESFVEALDGARILWKAVQAANTPRALAGAWVLDASQALSYSDAPQSADDAVEADDPDIEIIVEGAPPSSARPRAPGRRIGRKREGVSGRAEALRREILGKHERLEELDRYELLGLDRDVDTDAIKRAYHQAAKSYHPDALASSGLDAELREKANRVFAEISKAHAVLSDPQRRQHYDLSLETPDTDIDANRLAQAETMYRKAEILLRQGNFRGALEFLQPAVELWPEECAYQSALGWALYKQTPSEPEAAREHLELALRIDPDDAETQFRLGIVARTLDEAQ